MAADRAAQERLAARMQGWLQVSPDQARIAAQGRDSDATDGMSVTQVAARKMSRVFGISERDAARVLLTDPRARRFQ